MKILNLKYIAISLFAVASFSLQSCCSDDNYDVVGNPDNLFYIKAISSSSASSPNTLAYEVVHTPVGDFGDFTAKFPVRCLKPIGANATVNAILDNSLINAYNSKYSKSYVAMPDGSLDLSKMSVTILKDSCKGKDSLTISVSNANLSKLTADAYIAPIRISSIDGVKGKGSEDYGVAYVVVTTKTKLIKENVASTDMLGTLVTDYTGWTGKYCDGTALDISSVTNNNTSDSGWGLTADNNTVIVDMQSVKNVTGIRSCRWYSYWPEWDWGYGYSFSNIDFYLSEDGNKWIEAGSVSESQMQEDNKGYQYICLYGAVKARYLKMTYLSGSSTVSSLSELGIYVQ